MTLPLVTRQSDILRYDRDHGVVIALDRQRYPQETVFVEYADVAAVIRTMETTMVQGKSLAYIAGYGVALAARAWQDRPSDPRRAAIIQAAEQIRLAYPTSKSVSDIIEQSLVHANTAILAGANAEEAIVTFVDEEVRRQDRVAERCGRHAADLLTHGDRILTRGVTDAALHWMLYSAHTTQEKQIQIAVIENQSGREDAYLLAHQAGEIGIPVTVVASTALEAGLIQKMFSLYMVAAQRVALNGSVASIPGTSKDANLVRQHAVPCYVLGYDGPDPTALNSADIALAKQRSWTMDQGSGSRDQENRETLDPEAAIAALALDVIPPNLINAIVTDRGLYRPDMIARYLEDGETPFDVIPLLGGSS